MPQLSNRTEIDREFHFTDADFQVVRQLIYQHAGIQLSPSKRDMVYSRLSRRLRALDLQRFDDYLSVLKTDKDEWESFVNALTTNLTAFFREPHHFPLLAEHITQHKSRSDLSLWCAAASTGEEPYSMAMTMVELFNSWTPPVKIFATDIDTQVLKVAQAGIYPLDRVKHVDEARLKRFFQRGKNKQEGFVKVHPALQAMVSFAPLNLLAAKWACTGPFDAIFCRNVMIYFDKKTQYDILHKFIPVLRKDGLLFAGHSESFQHATDLITLRNRTVYNVASSAKPRAATAASRAA